MKHLLVLGMILSTPTLLAETIKSKVHSIENNIIRFENGRVAFLDKQSAEINASEFIEAEVDNRSTLISFKRLMPPNIGDYNFQPEESIPPVFEPTVVPDIVEALKIFNRSNPNYKRISECSDRAHVWAHEEFKRSGTKSMKAFVFFSTAYINSVRFKWWFHVAPMYRVNNKGTLQDLVMDFRYMDRPVSVREWTDQYVYTKAPCKTTKKFSDYELTPQTESCFVIFESMHYRIPAEIHDQELRGKYKTTTTETELKEAYRYAFQE